MIRLQLEKKEEMLSLYAAKSKQARRDKDEEPCHIRTSFQRDRDRILYSKAFRRLKHKTQVFIVSTGDHYVTRLTHTLQVSQIARTIARALNLNEDLAEAISLGHDLGHTPFGHIGESVLNHLYSKGFNHNEQSIRVVEVLEKNGKGLNLTKDVRDGILKHSWTKEKTTGLPNTLEGEVCKIADKIAYINHDIDDAIRVGIIKTGDLPRSAIVMLGNSHSERINSLISDIIDYSSISLQNKKTKPTISLSPSVLVEMNILRSFLFENVYNLIAVTEKAEEARSIVFSLYHYFTKNPNKIPDEFISEEQDRERRIVDYIAGMTDQFAIKEAEKIKTKRF